MKWLKLFENFDDVETMVRHQLFGVDAQIAFEFCDERITNSEEIKNLIDMYNQTVIESDQWSGGPVNNEFIEYWNNSGKKKKASRNNWKPCIELHIQTDDYGKMIIGFSIINKKVSKVNWSQLSDDVKGYDRKVVDGIYRFVKNKIDEPDLNINQTIDLLKLRVTNWVDWKWREDIKESNQFFLKSEYYQKIDPRSGVDDRLSRPFTDLSKFEIDTIAKWLTNSNLGDAWEISSDAKLVNFTDYSGSQNQVKVCKTVDDWFGVVIKKTTDTSMSGGSWFICDQLEGIDYLIKDIDKINKALFLPK